ncbi:MAG: hypothetical protein M0038_14570 [Pseudomonadota bacterium]|jgi:hypothetical protein|nr:hypothetical protein [Pseudomonadota bacterium]
MAKVPVALRRPRFIGFALLALLLCGCPLVYGLVLGVPQWNSAFQGALQPLITAYDGWSVTLGIVGVGALLVGGALVLGWRRATFDYVLLALGFLGVLIFIWLGLPSSVATMVNAAVSLLVVGLCALLVVTVFLRAVRERLNRRYQA